MCGNKLSRSCYPFILSFLIGVLSASWFESETEKKEKMILQNVAFTDQMKSSKLDCQDVFENIELHRLYERRNLYRSKIRSLEITSKFSRELQVYQKRLTEISKMIEMVEKDLRNGKVQKPPSFWVLPVSFCDEG